MRLPSGWTGSYGKVCPFHSGYFHRIPASFPESFWKHTAFCSLWLLCISLYKDTRRSPHIHKRALPIHNRFCFSPFYDTAQRGASHMAGVGVRQTGSGAGHTVSVKKTMEQFMVSLMNAFPFPTAVYKGDSVFPTVIVQKIHDLVQVCRTDFLCKGKVLLIFQICQPDGHSYFGIHLLFPFPHGLLPDKRIFVGMASGFIPSIKTISLESSPTCERRRASW